MTQNTRKGTIRRLEQELGLIDRQMTRTAAFAEEAVVDGYELDAIRTLQAQITDLYDVFAGLDAELALEVK